MVLAFVAGTALQLQQARLWLLAVYLALLCVALVVLAHHAFWRAPAKWARWYKGALQAWVVLSACLVLGFAWPGLLASVYDAQRLAPALEGRDVVVRAMVRGLPQSNPMGVRFGLEVEQAWLDGAPVALPARIDVGWYRGLAPRSSPSEPEQWALQRQPQDLRPGERWQMTLRLKAPHGNLNFQGFDYELWMWERGVQASAYVRAGAQDAPPQRLAATLWYPVDRWRQNLRSRIEAAAGGSPSLGLLVALVVGEQSAISNTDWALFRVTGVAHLVSISGLHITMFAWAARWLIGWLWRRSLHWCLAYPAPYAAWVGGVFAAGAYALFSGAGVPAQRTWIMLAGVAALRLSGLRWPWPQVWLLALGLVVLCDPWAVMQAGFWLSFVAVGVLLATDARPQQMEAPGHIGNWWGARAGAHLVVQCGALVREQLRISAALAPLTVLLFGQFSVVGLAANLLAVPWVTLVITPLAMGGVLCPPLWSLAALAGEGWMVTLQWLGAWPWAVWALPLPPLWLGAAAGGAGILLCLPLPWHVRLLGTPLLAALLLWRPPAPPVGEFSLLAADIGQGNAVLVRTAHHALLYDTGPRYSLESDAGQRVLVPLLDAQQVRLERLVLSHRDADHVGGAAAVRAAQPQADVLSSLESGHPLLDQAIAMRCQAGQRWEWDGVHLEVLHPLPEAYAQSTLPKPNALSCVLRVQSAGGPQARSALLVGDLEAAGEAQLLGRAAATGQSLAADFLLVPHHGSKTSSSAAFVEAVHPRTVLVQAGYRNRYGHPAPTVVQRYQDLAASYPPKSPWQWQDSPHCGAFLWKSWEPENGICARMAMQRYWHHAAP